MFHCHKGAPPKSHSKGVTERPVHISQDEQVQGAFLSCLATRTIHTKVPGSLQLMLNTGWTLALVPSAAE